MNEFFKKRLKNGLTVLFEKRMLPVVAVSASVRWGSIFETRRNKGISHFIEHLMFKGTKTRSQEEIAREIEKKGGVLNAFTSEEVTSYWNKLPSKHVRTGVDISSDLILNPLFDKAEFEKEKNVIIEEIKMYHDNPRFYVMDKIKELLYKKPFGMSIAGNGKIIKNMGLEQVKQLFSSVYTSDNMILTVVGKADFEEVCEQAASLFPATNRSVVEKRPEKINSELREARAGIDQTHFVFGFHAATLQERERYANEVMGAYLFGGMSSRFFQEIREKRGLAYSIKGEFDLGSNYGYCAIYAGTSREKTREIKSIILKEINNLRNMPQRDFDECKEQLIGSKSVEEEDSSNAMNLLMLEEAAGNAQEYYKYEERISAVSLEQLKKYRLKDYSCFSLLPK